MSKNSVFQVSQTKIKLWRKCRKAYYYRYVDHLRRKKVTRPLIFGRIVHDMTEAQANGDDPFAVLKTALKEQGKLFASEREMYGDIINDIRLIMEEYFSYWEANKKSLTYIRHKKRNAEHEFSLMLTSEIELVGKIDAFGRANKLTWLVERKTFGKRANEDHRWRNIQSAIYCRAVDMMDWLKLDGICWDYIWSRAPARPEQLKDGSLSKKKIISLPSAIKETLARLAPRLPGGPKEYESMIKSAALNRKEYFFRVFNPIDTSVSNMIMDDFVVSANEAKDTNPATSDKFVRSIDRHCDWCDFEPLCRAELMNQDVDYVIEREYEKKPRPEEPIAVED